MFQKKTSILRVIGAVAVITLLAACGTVPPDPQQDPMFQRDDPEFPDLYHSIGLSIQAGDPVAAVQAFEEAEARNPDDPQTQVLFANLLIAAGAFTEADRVFESVLEIDPDNTDALYTSALLAGARGDRTTQEKHLNRVVDLEPDGARAHAALGEMYMESRRFRDARRSFETSLEKDPDHFVALAGLGNALIRERNHERAEKVLTRAIEVEPEFAFAYVDRSRARLRTQNLRGAEADLDRAIELEPEYVWNYLDRGRVRAQIGRLEPAVQDFTRAIELDPSIFITFVHRGYALDSLNRTEQAIQDLEHALALRPEYHPAYAPLGTLYFENEDWDKAHRMFVKAYAEADQEHSYPLLATLALKFADREPQARRYLEGVIHRMPRTGLYYQMARYYLLPGSDTVIFQQVQREQDNVMKARMSFFLAAQYELLDRIRSAQALYNEVKDTPFPGLIEHRLAGHRLDRYR